MNLSKVKLVKEDQDTFHLHDGKKPFAIHKKYIRPETLKQISQHFAEGGEVQDPVGEAFANLSASPDEIASDKARQKVESGVRAIEDASRPKPSLWDTVKASYADPMVVAAQQQGGPASAATPEDTTQNMTPATGFTPGPDGQPQPESVAPTPQAAPARPPPQGAGIPGYESTINGALKQATGAEQAKADVATQQGQQMLELQQRHELERQTVAKEWEDRWKSNQARADQLTQDIATSKLDPQRWWKSRNTGQQVAATIGLILGGIGQAFGGGQNQALALIDKSIERDVDAQKTELGKKQNLLSHYLDQGHSLQAARQLAIADNKDALAGQLQMVASKTMGQAAQANAQANIAALKTDAAKTRMSLMQEGQKIALGALQVKQAQQAMDVQKQELAAVGALAGGDRKPAGAGGGEEGIGIRLSPQQQAILSMHKEIGPRLVTLPNGNQSMAKTDEDAKKIKDVMEKTQHYQDLLGQMRALHEKHPHGISQFASPEDYGAALRLQNSAIETAGEVANLTRFTGEEAKLREIELPNLTETQIGNVAKGQLDAAAKDANSRILRSLKNRLVNP